SICGGGGNSDQHQQQQQQQQQQQRHPETRHFTPGRHVNVKSTRTARTIPVPLLTATTVTTPTRQILSSLLPPVINALDLPPLLSNLIVVVAAAAALALAVPSSVIVIVVVAVAVNNPRPSSLSSFPHQIHPQSSSEVPPGSVQSISSSISAVLHARPITSATSPIPLISYRPGRSQLPRRIEFTPRIDVQPKPAGPAKLI
ncbi:hypothetical protein V493_07818, partial [Pseudogymnoascus sp. VKM F-4281 (FW-2241)]